MFLWGARDGAVVRALDSHRCGPGSTPGVDVICGLSLLLVLSLTPRGFSLGTSVFPSPEKPTLPNSNSIWNARTRLNEFIWVNKQFTILLYFFKGCPIRTRRWCFFRRRQTVSYPQESGSHLALTSRCSSILAIGGFYYTVVNTSVDV